MMKMLFSAFLMASFGMAFAEAVVHYGKPSLRGKMIEQQQQQYSNMIGSSLEMVDEVHHRERILAEPASFITWGKTAKLGGAPFFIGMTTQEMDQVLNELVQQKVSVIEADSDLSNYMSDAQFELELDLMRTVRNAAHKRGLRVVWYYPALEVVTVNGKNIPETMYKEHPDWVQYGMNGQANVFYGGTGQVFWVAPNDESAWMSPSSPGYLSFFTERVKKIVATGIDGLWLDVPIYADFGGTKWSDFNPVAVAKFESDTGYTAPTVEDWNAPNFRRWITWRHEELARFLIDVTAAVRSINPEFPVYAETLPTDYNGGTIYGLDGSYLKHIEGLTHVWEVDSMSNNVGMRNAREDDWVSFISAYKYTKAASGNKPSWVFTYGVQEDDAELVMAEAIACGNNPYELKVPEMATTVGAAYRARMFGWAEVNTPFLFEAKSSAKVAIFYSGASRDFVDQFEGLGMFATWESGGDSLWWAGAEMDSAYARRYLAEFRGVVKLLVHEHIPFDTIVNPANTEELMGYETVILPNIEAISDVEASIMRQYVQGGGKLIVTGPNSTGYDEYGLARAEYALADLLGFSRSDPPPTEPHIGAGGSVYFYPSRLGKDYFVSNSASAKLALTTAIQATTTIPLTTNADRRVHFELKQLGDQMILQFVNFIGMDGSISIVPTSFFVSLTVPTGKQVTGVELTSPDSPSPALEPLSYTVDSQVVTFNVADLQKYAMVVVSLDGALNPQYNNLPVAGTDDFATSSNTALEFSDTMLLANDGDMDGDTIFVTSVNDSQASGSLVALGGGAYKYTPLQGFIGAAMLTYSISDGKGGTDTGHINIIVGSQSMTYYPETATVTTGTFDFGTMTSFLYVDYDTYDIRSASVSGGRAVDFYATTTILESAASIAQIKVSYVGHYSQTGVSQKFYVYNFQDTSWQLVDTSTVGNENYPVSSIIDTDVSKYISPQNQVRVRVSSFRSGSFISWSDAMTWEIFAAPAPSTSPPPPPTTAPPPTPTTAPPPPATTAPPPPATTAPPPPATTAPPPPATTAPPPPPTTVPPPPATTAPPPPPTTAPPPPPTTAPPPPSPTPPATATTLETKVVKNVEDTSWTTVILSRTFTDPIPVCSVDYGGTSVPLVVRMTGVAPNSNSFQIRLQNPGDGSTTTAKTVNCMVVEKGKWQMPDGRLLEAMSYTSTITDRKGSWKGETQIYGNSYIEPVVVGQVMTSNDSKWSVFWSSQPNSNKNPPSATGLATGKHVGEDSLRTRADETIGIVVMEKGYATTSPSYEAGLGQATVRGYGNSASGYSYTYSAAFSGTPAVKIVSQAAMDGGDGGWAVLTGSQTKTTLQMVIDEDQISDTERSHATEQVAYIVFEEEGAVELTAVGTTQPPPSPPPSGPPPSTTPPPPPPTTPAPPTTTTPPPPPPTTAPPPTSTTEPPPPAPPTTAPPPTSTTEPPPSGCTPCQQSSDCFDVTNTAGLDQACGELACVAGTCEFVAWNEAGTCATTNFLECGGDNSKCTKGPSRLNYVGRCTGYGNNECVYQWCPGDMAAP